MEKTKQQKTIKEIENDASSTVRLRCIKAYQGTWDDGRGKFMFYKYKFGEVMERTKIFLKPNHWEIA